MSDAGGPYLFDVGVIALAHVETPVSTTPLSYVRQAIRGDIHAVVPYSALFGAHVVLSSYYGLSNAKASRVLENFMDAKRIHWRESMPETVVRGGLDKASEFNIDGWDGYFAQVAVEEGVKTILTLDDDFTRMEGVSTDVVLTPDEFETLNEFLGY